MIMTINVVVGDDYDAMGEGVTDANVVGIVIVVIDCDVLVVIVADSMSVVIVDNGAIVVIAVDSGSVVAFD